MVSINLGLIRLINGIVGGIGSITLFLGVFTLIATGKPGLVLIGVIFTVASEITTIYLTKYEEKKHLEMFQTNFWNSIGTLYAFPLIMLALYLMSSDKFSLVFTIALTAGAVIKTASMLIKMAYIEKNF